MRTGEEQFREWYNRKSRLPLAVNGHSFVFENDTTIRVDGGIFIYEEAHQLARMLNSRNPFAQINANITIWERNGVLRLMVLALIAIILVAVIALTRR